MKKNDYFEFHYILPNSPDKTFVFLIYNINKTFNGFPFARQNTHLCAQKQRKGSINS